MEQVELDMFARKGDPETSHAVVGKLSKRAAQVLAVLRQRGPLGATSEQIARELGCARDSISPVMPKLESPNLVFRTGYKRQIGNSWQIIWIHNQFVNNYQPVGTDKEMNRKHKSRWSVDDLKQRIAHLESLLDIFADEKSWMVNYAGDIVWTKDYSPQELLKDEI